jgi:hypothetical protein
MRVTPSEIYLVWVSSENLKTTRLMHKLDGKQRGPFHIIQKISQGSYELKLLKTWKVHPIFNKSLLLPFRPLTFETQAPPPPPPAKVIDGLGGVGRRKCGRNKSFWYSVFPNISQIKKQRTSLLFNL